jgi:hypothetical protein
MRLSTYCNFVIASSASDFSEICYYTLIVIYIFSRSDLVRILNTFEEKRDKKALILDQSLVGPLVLDIHAVIVQLFCGVGSDC